MSLIREILRWLADQPSTWVDQRSLLDALDGDDDSDARRAVVQYHVDLCCQAGFELKSAGQTPSYQLTWIGHDKLEQAESSDAIASQ